MTNDDELAQCCRSLIAHGRVCTCEKCLAASSDSVCRLRLQTELDRRFCMVRIGYSYRIGELEGAIGVAQLEQRNFIMHARKSNAKYLTDHLREYEEYLQLPDYPEYVEHSFMMYPIVIRQHAPFSRKDLVQFLENNNIETRPMLPLLNHCLFSRAVGGE